MEKLILIEKIFKKNRKAQIWSLDLVIAVVIFLVGIMILFYYAINYSSQSKNQLDELFYRANLASELILSEEFPGILSHGIVNQTKLNFFNNLSDTEKRRFLGINNNFYFRMDNYDGYVGIINASEVDSLVKVTRLTIYKNKPTKFELFLWK